MPTAKKPGEKTAKDVIGSKSGQGEAYTKNSRCWPGYVPVPGKGEHEEGSCRKEPASKNGGKAVDRETARKKQIAMGGARAKQAKGKSPDAGERRSVSKSAKAAPAHKAASKKSSAKKATPSKKSAKKTSSKKAGQK